MRMGVAKPHGSAVGGQKDSHYKLGNGEPPRSGFVQRHASAARALLLLFRPHPKPQAGAGRPAGE